MVGWHHRLDGHEFEQAPGDGEEQTEQNKSCLESGTCVMKAMDSLSRGMYVTQKFAYNCRAFMGFSEAHSCVPVKELLN